MMVTKIEDLIPDVKFAVKQADDITIKYALTEAVEDLAYNHEFFLTKFATQAESHGELVDKAKSFVGEERFLGISNVEPLGERMYRLKIHLMPVIDEPYPDPEYLTKHRRVIVMHAITLLLFQTKEPWGDPEQAAIYARRSTEALESWKVATHVTEGGPTPIVQQNPYAIF